MSAYKRGRGIVVRFLLQRSNRLESLRVGDKFSSMHGQKGVVRMIYLHEDMSWTIALPRSVRIHLEVVAIHNLVHSKPLVSNKEDELVWGVDEEEDSGGFSVSDAYNRLIDPGLLVYPHEVIWKKHIPLKVQFFAWTASLNKIQTYDLLWRRGILCVNYCPLCKQSEESAVHLLIQCKFASEV